MALQQSEEAFLPFPAPRAAIPLATSFRSTWLTSSIRALRARSLLDKYLNYLPSMHHEKVLGAVAGLWLPIEVAMAHYESCDKLGLSQPDLIELGIETTTHVYAQTLQLATKAATTFGATPWSVLAQSQRMWDRMWKGGAVGVFKLGPKEARVEVVSWACARYGYTRTGMRGVLQGSLQTFCRAIQVTEIPSLCTNLGLGYKISWV